MTPRFLVEFAGTSWKDSSRSDLVGKACAGGASVRSRVSKRLMFLGERWKQHELETLLSFCIMRLSLRLIVNFVHNQRDMMLANFPKDALTSIHFLQKMQEKKGHPKGQKMNSNVCFFWLDSIQLKENILLHLWSKCWCLSQESCTNVVEKKNSTLTTIFVLKGLVNIFRQHWFICA